MKTYIFITTRYHKDNKKDYNFLFDNLLLYREPIRAVSLNNAIETFNTLTDRKPILEIEEIK